MDRLTIMTPKSAALKMALQPCPFCGGEAKLFNSCLTLPYVCSCLSCRAEGPCSATDVGAVKLWNRRCESLNAPPCYRQDDDGCAYQVYDSTDEPIDKCKECPLCYSDKQRHQSPTNTPLTMEELWGMDREPVVLPCKVGDLVYEVDEPEYGVITCRVLYINYYTGPAGHVPGNPMVSTISIGVEVIGGHGKGSSYCFEQEDIGKSVFLTRQEAEGAILAYRRKPEEGTK